MPPEPGHAYSLSSTLSGRMRYEIVPGRLRYDRRADRELFGHPSGKAARAFSRLSSLNSHQPLSRPIRRCMSAAALIFRAGKRLIHADWRLKRAFPPIIVSYFPSTVSNGPEKWGNGGKNGLCWVHLPMDPNKIVHFRPLVQTRPGSGYSHRVILTRSPKTGLFSHGLCYTSGYPEFRLPKMYCNVQKFQRIEPRVP